MTSRIPVQPDADPQPAMFPAGGGSPAPSELPERSHKRTPHSPPWGILAAIAAGAVLGGPARYGLGLAFPTAKGTFPATTFAINVSGSFILALLLVFILEIWPPTTYVRPFAAIGFCGAYTTFSTWMVDIDRLLAGHHYGLAAADMLGSLAAGLAFTSLGFAVGRGLLARHGQKEGRAR